MSQRYYFSGHMQDGKIYDTRDDGKPIGVSNELYNDLLNHHEEIKASYNEYQAKLVELGVIQLPLTPEQIIEKQGALLEKQSAQLERQTAQIEELLALARDVRPTQRDGKGRFLKNNHETPQE